MKYSEAKQGERVRKNVELNSEDDVLKTENIHRYIVENANSLILQMDREGNVLYINKFAQNFFGYSEKDILGVNVVGTIVPETDKEGISLADMMKDLGQHPERYVSNENENMRKNGERVWIAWTNRAIYDEKEQVRGMISIGNDITGRKQAEEKLRQSEEKYRSLIQNLNVGVYRNTGGDHGRFLEVNPAMVKILGFDSIEEIMNSPVSSFYQYPDERKLFIEEILRHGFVKNKELRLRKKDGTPIWASCFAKIKYNDEGGIEWIDGIIDDITARKLAEDKLWYEAIHDPLSDLYNRRYFMDQLASNVHSAKRYGYPLSACLCDLDNFKSVNDTYGHKMGDDVILAFAKIVKEELRDEDISGRYGGDEFCIYFPHISASEAAVSVERIRRRFSKLVFGKKEGTPFSITATFGIAELTPQVENKNEILKFADDALYKAKELGRNCVLAHE